MDILVAASGFSPDRKLFRRLHRQAYPKTRASASREVDLASLDRLRALQSS